MTDKKIKMLRKKSTSRIQIALNQLRSYLKGSLKDPQKEIRTLGCSIEYLKKYIEKQFKYGMTWNNWGKNNKDENGYYWEIDHIKPLVEFNILDKQIRRQINYYKNLRPCWGWANHARKTIKDCEIDFNSPVKKFINPIGLPFKRSSLESWIVS